MKNKKNIAVKRLKKIILTQNRKHLLRQLRKQGKWVPLESHEK